MLEGRISATTTLCSRSAPLQSQMRHWYIKSLPSRGSRGKTRKSGRPTSLRTGRRFSWRFRCHWGRFCCRSGRFRSRSRTGCFSCCWWTRGCWACRGFGCLCLLLARRKERGTGQDADVFFHSVNWKSHIALTD
jgi:hypothetical protein